MFPLQGCTLTEINVARQDIAKNRRGSIGNEKVLLPNYCKVVGADGIDMLFPTNDPGLARSRPSDSPSNSR